MPEPGHPQAWDRYAYVYNNPVRYVDPAGHEPCLPKFCGYIHDYEEEQPASEWLIVVLADNTNPDFPLGYDPAESVQQAWQLVGEWFFEIGPTVRYFGPESSLTRDIMHDPGITRFREAWAAAGCPLPWKWEHSADVREGGLLPVRIAKGALVYAREHLVELPLATGLAIIGWGPENPESSIDAVGGIIGSLDSIHVKNMGSGLVKIEVINKTDWPSGTRIPGTNRSLIPWRLPRSAWGPGGAIVQHFYWWELVPRR